MSIQRLVIVETPFSGEVERNVKYARACLRDCLLNHKELAIASHLLYTQSGVLNDNDENERKLGIDVGLEWGLFAQATIVYTNLGISNGMKIGIESAKSVNRQIEYRELAANWLNAHDKLVYSCRNHPFSKNYVSM